eukprot:6458356-Amphidinium_carterae.3
MAPTLAPYHHAEVTPESTSLDQFRHSGNHFKEDTGQCRPVWRANERSCAWLNKSRTSMLMISCVAKCSLMA